MDMRMPKLDGGGDAPAPRRRPHLTRVLVPTTFDLDDDVYEALNTGVTGFVRKGAT